MALVLKDRVKESSSSSGTGNITLSGAFPGYQTFNAAIASGSTVYYTIHNLTAGSDTEWEVGLGTFTSPATLARTTVLSSSTGSLINFTAGAGGLEVFITQPAEEAVYLNQATGLVEIGGNGTNTVSFTNVNTTNLTANTVTVTAGTISTNAANATDITNKTYVDGLFSTGITYHAPVRVESPNTVGNLNATYNQPGGAGVGVGATLTNAGSQAALVIDGITMVVADRVLIYNQTNAFENGVYTVTNVGSVSTNWILTRATDADTFGLANPNTLGQGDAFFVTSGNTGAGETYILNTVGTITFGTTNITFAQISSAQVYSAGTGLNLTNLTFSISNTAVTAAQYGNDGAIGQFTVNAQGQITNAANVSINASSISVGTLANGRTTAASANGASTIVLRDSNGDFAANTITATTSNATTFNGTTGSFTNVSGNGVALTAINASNVTSGTLANARTTASDANGASTIVSRDANGSFGANIVTATFSGNGATLSAINASNISSGTIANARTTASSSNGASTIVQRDSGGNFSANTVTAAVIGDLSGGSNINASNIASGTIANARTTASSSNGASTIVLRGASGEFAAGAITGASFSGNGSALTAINATAITTGTIDNARTTAASANGASTIVARDAGGNFSANTITATTFSGAMSGNGAALTNINASNISSGTIANARTTAASANGASTIVARDASGDFAADIATLNGITVGTINSSFDTDVLFVDATNNRVGIGTSSPSAKLDVNGNIISRASGAEGGELVLLNPDNASAGLVIDVSAADTARIFGTRNNLFMQIGQLSGTGGTITAFTAGTARMFIGDTGNVGIGTTSPYSQLDVYSTIASPTTGEATGVGSIRITNGATALSSAGGLEFKIAGDSNGYGAKIQTINSGGAQLVFANRNASATWTERMRIDSSGNVGIGIANGTAKLTVAGSNANNAGSAATFIGSIQINEAGSFTLASTGGLEFKASTFGAGYGVKIFGADDGSLLIGNRANSATWSERMRIDQNGNVGIGTASPNTKLHVQGADVRFTQANYVGGTTGSGILIDYTSTYSRISSYTNGFSAWGDLILQEAGKVGIGTTTPSTALQVNGTVTATTFSGAGTSLTGTASSLSIGGSSGSTVYPAFSGDSVNIGAITSRIDSGFYENSVPTTGGGWPVTGSWYHLLASTHSNDANYYSMQIAASFFDNNNLYYRSTAGSGSTAWVGILTTSGATFSGNLTMSGTIQANSDEKLKTNWRSVQEEFVAKLAKVKSGVYDRVDKELTQVGVSAQSLQKLIPEAVVEGADGYLSVNYGGAAMVSCVEMAKVIEELRAEIAELKAKIKE